MTPRSVQIWFQNRRQRLKPAAAQTRKDGLSRSASYGDSSHLRKALEGEQHRSGLSQSGAYQRGSHPALNAALNSIPALAAAAAAGLGQHDDVYYRLPPYASSGQTTGSSSYSITFDHSAPLDVMDKFAATKALLGAGACSSRPGPAHPPNPPRPACATRPTTVRTRSQAIIRPPCCWRRSEPPTPPPPRGLGPLSRAAEQRRRASMPGSAGRAATERRRGGRPSSPPRCRRRHPPPPPRRLPPRRTD